MLDFLSLRRGSFCRSSWQLCFAGLLPLFVYDAISFGNPLLLPNVAGSGVFADTFFHFDPRNFGDKLYFYASSVAAYVPVFAIGLLGLSYYPRQLKRRAAVSDAARFDGFCWRCLS